MRILFLMMAAAELGNTVPLTVADIQDVLDLSLPRVQRALGRLTEIAAIKDDPLRGFILSPYLAWKGIPNSERHIHAYDGWQQPHRSP